MIKQIKAYELNCNGTVSHHPSRQAAYDAAAKKLGTESAMGCSVAAKLFMVNTDSAKDAKWLESVFGARSESLVDKFKDIFEATRPQAKPAQLDLFDFRKPDYGVKPRAPERGFENEVNPAHVAAGAIGGHATAGVKRAASPDRRKPGTVNVDQMDVQTKREYWRWAGDRKAARKAGCRVLGWDEWKTLKQGLTNPGNAV